MSFKDTMAADLNGILSSDEFDELGTYTPVDVADSFPARVVRSDIETATTQFDHGIEHTRACEAIVLRTTIRTGIENLTGTARDPVRNDKITLDDGDWFVATVSALDVGGGLTLKLVRDDYANAAGSGAVEVR